jgi:hypothetical protein
MYPWHEMIEFIKEKTIFGGLFKADMPLLKKGTKTLEREALKTGLNIAGDVVQGINIKPVISILAGTRIMISPLQDIWFRTIDGTVTIQPLDKKSLLN